MPHPIALVGLGAIATAPLRLVADILLVGRLERAAPVTGPSTAG